MREDIQEKEDQEENLVVREEVSAEMIIGGIKLIPLLKLSKKKMMKTIIEGDIIVQIMTEELKVVETIEEDMIVQTMNKGSKIMEIIEENLTVLIMKEIMKPEERTEEDMKVQIMKIFPRDQVNLEMKILPEKEEETEGIPLPQRGDLNLLGPEKEGLLEGQKCLQEESDRLSPEKGETDLLSLEKGEGSHQIEEIYLQEIEETLLLLLKDEIGDLLQL